jgi:hypothetical protein
VSVSTPFGCLQGAAERGGTNALDPDELEYELQDHDIRVQKHGVEWAEERLRSRSPDVAELVIATYRERIGEPLRSCGLVAAGHEGWYLPKPDGESPRWMYARGQLGLPDHIVEKTSRVADEILARLANPSGAEIATRGLVLGHVQSGKTTSFLSVAAKAADNGYDLIIILAGVHNSLRRQTQNRAVRTLVHKPDLWWLGTALGDFKQDGNSLKSHLAGNGKRGLLVVKKHPRILGDLANWLEKEQAHDAWQERSVLVIDDEADQAGLDVSSSGELEGIHKQLRRILDLTTSGASRRCAYLAYTATPYANILTSQDDYGLYPSDFIYPLDRPERYVGSQELFGDDQIGLPVRIETDESDAVTLTEGMKDAIRWFVLATAARVGLGSPLETFHSSMLIHTTQRTEDQLEYRPLVEGFLRELLEANKADPDGMQPFYEASLTQVPARPGGRWRGTWTSRPRSGPLFDPTWRWSLRRLIERTPAGEPFKEDGREQQAHSGVIVDNSRVDWRDRLTYSDIDAGQESVTVIAIGGNTLSRGLTLEGLVCSYFARTARTYDSLMQMGRWYGFRPGYRHLLRVWTTEELLGWFGELNQVEVELRQELVWMQEQSLPPSRYGPRIRVSPSLNITRAAAMRSVARHVSYSDSRIDPAWLDLDAAVISANQALTLDFVLGLEPWHNPEEPLRYRGVPIKMVRNLLENWGFHESERRLDLPSLLRYLDRETHNLQAWNVIFKSVSGPSNTPYDMGGTVGVITPVVRSQQIQPSGGCIGSIVDSSDHRADFGGTEASGGARFRGRHEPPLLTLYTVDPTSTPKPGSNRLPLNASSHPLSMALALPQSSSDVEYVAPALKSADPFLHGPDLGDIHDG